MDTPTFNVLSLCSGVGGLDLGIKLACPDARTVCYVEIEAYACEVLASRMEDQALDHAPIWTDLRAFDGTPWRGVVDCIVGGYPCQPFSVAGKRQGAADPRHLWPDIARIVREVQPSVCFFENVPGHLSIGFPEVARELQEMGYRVTAGLFSAEEIGAPHRRERLFILANNNNSGRCFQRQCGVCQDGKAQSGCDPYGSCSAPVANDDDDVRIKSRPGSDNTYQRPTWPPGPENTDRWAEVTESEPTLEPSLLRVANGMADRVDRLRACGNGVVPAVAAKAWIKLSNELH